MRLEDIFAVETEFVVNNSDKNDSKLQSDETLYDEFVHGHQRRVEIVVFGDEDEVAPTTKAAEMTFACQTHCINKSGALVDVNLECSKQSPVDVWRCTVSPVTHKTLAAVLISDEQGRILQASAAHAVALFGFTHAQFEQLTIDQIVGQVEFIRYK